MKIILALLLGGAFGYILQRIGATNPTVLINMLRLRNFHLMKVILLGIGAASIVVFALAAINPELTNFSVKTAYIGVLIGGLIFGLGFAIAGYCPGTSVAAIGEGRKDAMFFVLGGLVSALLFTLVYGWLKSNTSLFDKVVDTTKGKVTLANTGVEKYGAMIDWNPMLVAGVVAAVFIVIAWLLPSKIDKTENA